MKLHLIYIPVFLLALLPFCVFAQNANFQWAQNIGSSNGTDRAFDVATDAMNNVYVIGQFLDSANFSTDTNPYSIVEFGRNVFISKYDPDGNLKWVNILPQGEHDGDYGIVCDVNGYINITGISSGKAFISQLDTAGNVRWNHIADGNSCSPTSIISDMDGNLFLTGYFNNNISFSTSLTDPFLVSTGGSSDIFICKFDSDGEFQWQHSIGNSGVDRGFCAVVDNNANLIITGFFSGQVDFNPDIQQEETLTSTGYYDIFVCKLNSAGSFQWAKSMGSIYHDEGVCLAVNMQNEIYLAGIYKGTCDMDPGPGVYSVNTPGDKAICLGILDSEGEFLWAVSLDGTGHAIPQDMILDAAGDVILTGYHMGSIDFNPDPNLASGTQAFGNGFICKFSSNLAFMWLEKFLAQYQGGIGRILIDLDEHENMVLAGAYHREVDFAPGLMTYYMNSESSLDNAFICKMGQSSISTMNVLQEPHAHLFPNPVSEVLYLDLSTLKAHYPMLLKITSTDGKVLLNIPVSTEILQINVANYPSGTYYVSFESAQYRRVFPLLIVK